MVEQLKDDLLHKRTIHTNLSVPFQENITPESFPQQNTELLDSYVTIRYRNMYIVDRELTGPELYEPHDIYEANCRVLRCDLEEPYRMIVMSDNYQFLLVTDSRYWEEKVVQYPIQFNEFIGITVYDQYAGIIPEVKGVTLRVDNGEPCYSVIMEFLADNVVRFLIGDECFSKLYDYYGVDNDWNGRDPVDYQEEYRDADGERVTRTVGVIQFTDINGGPPDTLRNIYNEARSTEEIIALRKEVLEGKTIYASTKTETTGS